MSTQIDCTHNKGVAQPGPLRLVWEGAGAFMDLVRFFLSR